jgi:hypothetical protein
VTLTAAANNNLGYGAYVAGLLTETYAVLGVL